MLRPSLRSTQSVSIETLTLSAKGTSISMAEVRSALRARAAETTSGTLAARVRMGRAVSVQSRRAHFRNPLSFSLEHLSHQ